MAMVALRGQRASSHPATSLLDLKRSPELNHVVWPPLPSTLAPQCGSAPRHGRTLRTGPAGGWVGCRSRPQRGTGRARNRTERAERAKACPVVVVRCRYSVIRGLWRHGGAPRGRGSGGSNFARGRATARAAVDGRCRGWSADHAPRSAAVFAPLSRALFTAPHTAPL